MIGAGAQNEVLGDSAIEGEQRQSQRSHAAIGESDGVGEVLIRHDRRHRSERLDVVDRGRAPGIVGAKQDRLEVRAAALDRRAIGIAGDDPRVAEEFVLGAGAYHGRMVILDRTSAKESTGHGSPLPVLVHGGPGRAGGGEELGGRRGLAFYMQRTALQGSRPILEAMLGTKKA